MAINRRIRACAVTAILLVAVAACAPAPEPVAVSGDRDGLVLEAGVTVSGDSVAVDLVVRNERAEPVDLVATQCGRVVDAELARTVFLPEGRLWDGSVQAVK
jgi:hypothetical protein